MSPNEKFSRMSALISQAVKAAWFDNRAKRVALALGISLSAGKRAASWGRVHPTLRQRFIAILDEAIAANEAELRRLRRELQELENAESRGASDQASRIARVSAAGDKKDAGLK